MILFGCLLFINFVFILVPTIAPRLDFTIYIVDWIYLNILLLTCIIAIFYY